MYKSVIKIILLGCLLMNAASVFAGKHIEVSSSGNALPDTGWLGSTGGQQLSSTSDPAPMPEPDFDNQPDIFNFIGQNDVSLNTGIISNPIIIRGINAPVEVSIQNGEYRINNGFWQSFRSLVNNGDIVSVRHYSAETSNTQVTSTLIIGGVSGVFSSVTATIDQAEDTLPNASKADIIYHPGNGLLTIQDVEVNGQNFWVELEDKKGDFKFTLKDYFLWPESVSPEAASYTNGTLSLPRVYIYDTGQYYSLDLKDIGGLVFEPKYNTIKRVE